MKLPKLTPDQAADYAREVERTKSPEEMKKIKALMALQRLLKDH
jgi:hypothetical protein